MSDKIFAGSGKIIETQYGELPKITFHKDNINTIVRYMKDNNSDFVTLVMKQKRETVEGKPTHYLEIDQWKPKREPDHNKQLDDLDIDVEDSEIPF